MTTVALNVFHPGPYGYLTGIALAMLAGSLAVRMAVRLVQQRRAAMWEVRANAEAEARRRHPAYRGRRRAPSSCARLIPRPRVSVENNRA